ncbi:hypothetical protein TNCV_5070991 [Trichonephila clavipes]|nr:hypothetical protein TNCV_5070991 [Trichonephila clavipes]
MDCPPTLLGQLGSFLTPRITLGVSASQMLNPVVGGGRPSDDSLPDRQTCRVYRNFRDESESHRNARPQMPYCKLRRKEAEKKNRNNNTLKGHETFY